MGTIHRIAGMILVYLGLPLVCAIILIFSFEKLLLLLHLVVDSVQIITAIAADTAGSIAPSYPSQSIALILYFVLPLWRIIEFQKRFEPSSFLFWLCERFSLRAF